MVTGYTAWLELIYTLTFCGSTNYIECKMTLLGEGCGIFFIVNKYCIRYCSATLLKYFFGICWENLVIIESFVGEISFLIYLETTTKFWHSHYGHIFRFYFPSPPLQIVQNLLLAVPRQNHDFQKYFTNFEENCRSSTGKRNDLIQHHIPDRLLYTGIL